MSSQSSIDYHHAEGVFFGVVLFCFVFNADVRAPIRWEVVCWQEPSIYSTQLILMGPRVENQFRVTLCNCLALLCWQFHPYFQ